MQYGLRRVLGLSETFRKVLGEFYRGFKAFQGISIGWTGLKGVSSSYRGVGRVILVGFLEVSQVNRFKDFQRF